LWRIRQSAPLARTGVHGWRTEEVAHAALPKCTGLWRRRRARKPQTLLADRTKPSSIRRQTAGNLEALLGEYGIAVRTIPIYRAIPATRLPEAARHALANDRIDGVLHFSKRSAEAFLAAIEADRLREQGLALRHLCLSAEVAAPLIAAGAERVEVARRPDQQSLLELLDQA
jgi:uroporphyrinogen-III synthase